MVIDTSAVVAVLTQEPEARALAECIERDPVRLMSALNWLELHLVLGGRFGPHGALLAESFFRESSVEIVSMDSAPTPRRRIPLGYALEKEGIRPRLIWGIAAPTRQLY